MNKRNDTLIQEISDLLYKNKNLENELFDVRKK